MKNYKSLAYRNLINDKRNSVFIFITIALVITLMSSSMLLSMFTQKQELQEVLDKEGSYDIRLLDVNQDQVKKLDNSSNVTDYYLAKSLGVSVIANNNYAASNYGLESFYQIDELYAIDLKAFDDVFKFNLTAGRMPTNENEVVVTKDIVKEFGDLEELKNGYSEGLPEGYIPEDFETQLSVGKEITLDFETNRTYDMYLTLNQYKGFTITTEYGWSDRSSFNGSYMDEEYGPLVKEKKTLKVVGIIDVGENNTLWHNKFFTVLTPEAKANYTDFEVLTKLAPGATDEMVANELGLKFVPNKRAYQTPTPAHGVGASRVRYRNFWIDDYESIGMENSALAGITVVVVLAFIIVVNAFTASVAFKTKSMGVLSALGATKNQIRYLIIKEIFIVSLIAIPFGFVFGIGMIYGLSYLLSNLFNIDLLAYGMTLDIKYIVLIIVLTIGLSIIAIVFCLRKFFRYSPIEAMNNSSGIQGTTYTTKMGELVNENSTMKEYLDHDQSTLKYKFMKKVFKFEGEIAYKNLSRNKVMNTNCRLAILATMLLGSVFIYQYFLKDLDTNYSIPSSLWSVQATKGSGIYTDEEIEDILNIDGVNSVYRELVQSTPIISPNNKVNDELLNLIKQDDKWTVGKKNTLLTARVRGISNDYTNLYKDYIVEGNLDGGLKDNEIILISDWVNYRQVPNGQKTLDDSIVPIKNVLKYKVGEEIEIPLNMDIITAYANEKFENRAIGLDDYYNKEGQVRKLKIKAIVTKDALRDNERLTDPTNCNEDLEIIVSEDLFTATYGEELKNIINIDVDDSNRDEVINNIDKVTSTSGDSLNDLVKVEKELANRQNENLSINIMNCISVILLVFVSLVSTVIFNIFIRSRELAGLEAIGMSSRQKNKMIICESLALSIQAAFIAVPVALVLFITTLNNEMGTAAVSEVNIIMMILGYVLAILIVTTLVGLVPIRIMKDQSISELLRD